MIKLQKFATGVIDFEICMQRYHGEAHDGSYVVVPFYVLANDQSWWLLLKKLSAKHKIMKAHDFWFYRWRLSWWLAETGLSEAKDKIKDGGFGQKWPCMQAMVIGGGFLAFGREVDGGGRSLLRWCSCCR